MGITFLFFFLQFIINVRGFYILYTKFQKYYYKPKQYSKPQLNTLETKRVDITRDRYNKSKIPHDIDVIVIGSGIGGLSCAAYLSKVGKKVLVLEQHYIAGGCCHVFDAKGIEHDTGIHYIGNIEKRRDLLDLITQEPIEWCKMGRNKGINDTYENNGVYDELYIEDKHYLFRAGEENFINDLSTRFAGEENNIRNYIALVKKVSKQSLFFNMKVIKSPLLKNIINLYLKYWDTTYYKYLNTSAYDVIKSFTNNEELIAVLGGQFGDYGPTPKKANFFIHASIVNHYLEGGYFPKGGPSTIIKNIIPTIENVGGRVLVGKKVSKLIIKNNCVKGVLMENGDEIYAPKVISGVGVNTTFNTLIPDSMLENRSVLEYQTLIKTIGSSTGFIYCFVNLEGNSKDLELRDSNLWIYPNKDYDTLINNFENDIHKNPMPLFIASSSSKDISWDERYPNKSTAIILTMAKKEWFEQWETEKCMSRNLDYKDLKSLMGERMLNEGLYKYYPKTKGKVLHYEMGTPLTNMFYLGSLDGEGYGLNSNSNRYSQLNHLNPKTDIKNLYLTGQDICTLGFTGALMGGLITAHSILGYGTILDIITNKNLIHDLINMEKKNN